MNSATKGKNFAIIGALCLLAYLAGSVYLITKATNSTVYYEGMSQSVSPGNGKKWRRRLPPKKESCLGSTALFRLKALSRSPKKIWISEDSTLVAKKKSQWNGCC